MLGYKTCRLRDTLLAALIAILGTACSDLLSTPAVPDGTQSPTTYHSRQGGFELTKATIHLFRTSLLQVTIRSGLLTDELSSSSGSSEKNDVRELPELTRGQSESNDRREYDNLHKIRGQAQLARAILAEYAPDEQAVRGQLFAIEGYAVIMLADLFCSGVPLSSVDFRADYTYKPPSTTEEMYRHAITLFDSALAVSADSVGIMTLATVGRGRALLALGLYAKAESTVSNVEDREQYSIRTSFRVSHYTHWFAEVATVSDKEGKNGLPFLSSNDPRTLSNSVSIGFGSNNRIVNFPNKYHPEDSFKFRLASGVEARLIEAEAALNIDQYDRWIEILNQLRTSGAYRVDTLDSVTVDTVWSAGTGGFERLSPLADPGDKVSRIKLMFSERASWLFLEGQRQGDMRRLVRQYGMDRESVYPTGSYTSGSSLSGFYGKDITVPVPPEERRNPHFNGCLNRD